MFDAEFIEHAGCHLLIDVNPRFYNHMAFEVERGLPLPWLAYLGALGDRRALRAAVESTTQSGGGPAVYVHRLPLRMMLGLQSILRGMTVEERARWRSWLAIPAGRVTDPVRQDGDVGPTLGEIALETRRFVQHPRAYLRHLARPGPSPTKH